MSDAKMRHWSIDLTVRPDYIEAYIIHTPTGSSLSARADFEDFRPYYNEPNPNQRHSLDELAWGEAVGTLFSWMRDNFDSVGKDDDYPGEFDSKTHDHPTPHLRLTRYGEEDFENEDKE